MKKVLIALFVLLSIQLTAQTDGISYQAVIIGPDNQELPGVDAEGNILPDATVAIRFTIFDANNQVEYQEVQTANTDQYGRINLIIGQVDPNGFAEISWDGTNKDLKVEIDFSGGTSYVDMAREKLTFLPYAFHRNITATGTLTVDDRTYLNGELVVQGPTTLNSSLDVNGGNATNLSGDLTVDGNTKLNDKLEVAGTTVLNDTLNVNNKASTNLSGALNVGEYEILNEGDDNPDDDLEYDPLAPTNLAGTLDVQGFSSLDGGASITGRTELGDLEVNNTTQLKGETTISGQVTIKPDIDNKDNAAILTINDEDANQSNYNQYPLRVEGSYQGIAIKVKEGRGRTNNFVSFWDENGTVLDDEGGTYMWGRIEGLTLGQQIADPGYLIEFGSKTTDIAIATADVLIAILEWGQGGLNLAAALTSSTACVGVGACVTLPIPSWIGSKSVEFILKAANAVSIGGSLALAIVEGTKFRLASVANIGVSYQSGAGDYAEWLPKENLSDVFLKGDIVGIKNGKVTKKIWDAEKVMIVSTRPMILGNMPQPNREKDYVKVAFMGQVPVKVLGNVESGDYIIPNIVNNSFATAVNPKNMQTRDYGRIVGVAWNIMEELTEGLSLVNVAVGINANDMSEIVANQEEELKALQSITEELKKQINQSDIVLSKLVPGFKEAIARDIDLDNTLKSTDEINVPELAVDKEEFLVQHEVDDVLYFEIPNKQIEVAIEMARETYMQMLEDENEIKKLISGQIPISSDGLNKTTNSSDILDEIKLVPIEDHPFWKRIDSDPAYKEEIIQFIQSKLTNSYHTHKKYAHEFTDLKIRKD